MSGNDTANGPEQLDHASSSTIVAASIVVSFLLLAVVVALVLLKISRHLSLRTEMQRRQLVNSVIARREPGYSEKRPRQKAGKIQNAFTMYESEGVPA
ncbi:uncharacterized protein L969DRAFT_90188 [Mixia osmundae IAM 14324]|uniref:Uncharacterized protein n=1 Tax=Mixia osmundae (strain CBS 9802 / IAM 14324 / JCM 22182 / KY 12970) TaxID=764103 RepID=G7DSV9_MIXOS|nr:uncharacterized protein L969DRAFT_90188 [Mixia osmundae IAM 14324]KEI37125.1 hypothetical protein L969DRAFT_90188 [Mixia osmundae IAM 14324]GAA93669.1 hypothetical protein E5Q_00314 [Mixia osmundae IAM 14324]